ncbi:MAG: NADH-quinone oxidoreductase subunit J [Bacteroidota bacterium]|nr:NADH-quinone oxidoreductase subunit J [Bacteroidota bacterium]
MFYILSAFILGAGLLAVTTRKIFRSAIWLLFSLTGIAGLYFWLQMEFVAAVQIVVYVGGIVVLIIFSIFLTQRSGMELPVPARGRILFSALAALAGFALAFTLIMGYHFQPWEGGAPLQGGMLATGAAAGPAEAGGASIGNIGTQLLSADQGGYLLPFEVVSLLLLAAMIGCIVIAMKVKSADK